MNALHEEFEAAARKDARRAAERLRSHEARQRLAARVRRGRMVRVAGIGAGSVAALALVATAAIAVPRISGGLQPGSTAAPATPSPSATSAPAVDVGPAPAAVGGLVTLGSEWKASGATACIALAAQPDDVTRPDLPAPVPIPSTLETGRLYGWGDDVLVGGYPHPVPTELIGPVEIEAAPGETVTLQLTRADGDVWTFGLEFAQRDDLPHDAPGLFVSLSPVYDCSADGVIPPGVYQARMAHLDAVGSGMVAQVSDITVVEGVPSLPEVHAKG